MSLTPDNGTHSAQLSPHDKYVVGTFSQPDVAPETTLRDAKTGALIMPRLDRRWSAGTAAPRLG